MPSELAKALAAVQADLPAITKGETAEVKHKDTGRVQYTYTYADLADVSEAILPLLGKNGLAFTAWPTLDDGRFVLAYALIHESGEDRSGVYPLPSSGTPQQVGSAITYARRYCLCAVTGVAPGGDDNDAADGTEVHMDRGGRTPTRPPSDVPSRPVTPGPRPGAEHEQLRHGAVEWAPEDKPTSHGPPVGGDDLWQKPPPEEQPGSATREQVTGIQIEYGRLGFTSTERAQQIAASEQIIGRPLTGPNRGQTHNNLSYTEAVKLKTALVGTKKRADLVGDLGERAMAAAAHDAAEDSQEIPGDRDE